ncbi:MAG: hypothetical protein F4Y08_11215 [Caldilineaceae bacterium SB0662_bin_9]|uniref:Uncharacterized protein n=1 Tax=Caldilineaceae bacterium SB0662_bin_9 TaxID=2605258 RepID=A0A6B1DV12_9CHLR|nr:hypothetical protein [Caldilineaceae bacterium SB0662_bin_9]
MLPKHSRLTVLLLSGSLAASGVLLILINLELLQFATPNLQYLLSSLLLVGGLGFAWFFVRNRSNWWQLIPTFTCISLAAMLYLTTTEGFDPRLLAAILVWGMALSFLLAYVIDSSERWWGLVMGGLMVVLGLTIYVSSLGVTDTPITDEMSVATAAEADVSSLGATDTSITVEMLGAVLFGGLGLVFVLLFLLGDKTHFWWAPIPGFIMGLFAVFAYMETQPRWLPEWLLTHWWDWWPAVLVLAGFGIVVSAYLFPFMFRFSTQPEVEEDEDASETTYRSTPDVLREREGPLPGSAVIVLHEAD